MRESSKKNTKNTEDIIEQILNYAVWEQTLKKTFIGFGSYIRSKEEARIHSTEQQLDHWRKDEIIRNAWIEDRGNDDWANAKMALRTTTKDWYQRPSSQRKKGISWERDKSMIGLANINNRILLLEIKPIKNNNFFSRLEPAFYT